MDSWRILWLLNLPTGLLLLALGVFIPEDAGLAGGVILMGTDGRHLIRSTGKRWTETAENLFFDHLAATCNVTASAAAAGFCRVSVNARRRRDPAFAQRWQAALETAIARIEALLLRRAEEALEGWAPDTDLRSRR